MALSINDVIALANAGFTKGDIAAFMNLGNPQTTPPSPVQVPGATAPAVQTVPNTHKTDPLGTDQQAPALPDLSQLVATLADLKSKVDTLAVPTAGAVGALPTVTSVEDIIMGALKPAPAPESPSFNMEGVVK